MSYEKRKIRVGKVVSDLMDKTVVVAVEWRKVHSLYGKATKRRTRFKAHDETNSCRIGDLIRIVESRPLSRTKRWRVVEILSREEIAELQPEDIVVAIPGASDAEMISAEMVAGAVVTGEEPELAEEPEAEQDDEATDQPATEDLPEPTQPTEESVGESNIESDKDPKEQSVE